jgi:ATP-dependent protease ClpP protease subunit
VDFKYVLDATSEEPIMLIDKHIGNDSTEGNGIMGDQFTRELMFLDSLNKKSIQVWINSGGGVVTDGEQIFHAILKSKTPVDTVNTGTVASIAGPIFMAGRKRYMMDYAKIMMHPVSGGDEKSMQAFEQSIQTMLSSRSFLSENDVKKLMKRTSWIFPNECKDMGLCTEIDSSHGLNNVVNSGSYKDYTKIVNKLIENKKVKKMDKITNKLNLVEGSNEETILNAIDALENKYKVEVSENKSKFEKYVAEMSEAKANYDSASTKYNELKAKFEEMEDKVKCANELEASNKLEALKNEAKIEIENAVKFGKVENKAETIEKLINQYISAPELTKDILNAIPVSVKAPTIKKEIAILNSIVLDATNTIGYVERMNTINLNKAINRIK